MGECRYGYQVSGSAAQMAELLDVSQDTLRKSVLRGTKVKGLSVSRVPLDPLDPDTMCGRAVSSLPEVSRDRLARLVRRAFDVKEGRA